MIEIIGKIITNILQALYSSFFFSAILAFFAQYLYLFSHHADEGGKGVRDSIKIWFYHFRNEAFFRKQYFFILYASAIAFRTVLNRNFGLNPLSEIWGSWWLYKTDLNTGEVIFTTECLENLVLFIPLTFLYYMCYMDVMTNIGKYMRSVVWHSSKMSLIISLGIEFVQLYFRVGSFQLSDIVYNTAGGIIGAVLYCAYRKMDKTLKL